MQDTALRLFSHPTRGPLWFLLSRGAVRLQRAGVGGAVSYALSALHALPPPAAELGQSRPGGRSGSPQPHLGPGILPPQASVLSPLFCQLPGGPERFCVLPGVTQLQEGSPGSAVASGAPSTTTRPPSPPPAKRLPTQSENGVGSMNSAHLLQIAPPRPFWKAGAPRGSGWPPGAIVYILESSFSGRSSSPWS